MELVHGNILETVVLKSVAESDSKSVSKKNEKKDTKTGQKTDQKVDKNADKTIDKKIDNSIDQKPFEMDSKSFESAALTAGRNAVSCLRNTKKTSSAFPGTKVRQACLKIPLVYSHRSQRLPPIVSTGSVERTLQGENSVINMKIESDIGKATNSDNIIEGKPAYYFPSLDSENWLCVFQKQ